jgi:hypothetical protein
MLTGSLHLSHHVAQSLTTLCTMQNKEPLLESEGRADR